jgi:hypothetical protein
VDKIEQELNEELAKGRLEKQQLSAGAKQRRAILQKWGTELAWQIESALTDPGGDVKEPDFDVKYANMWSSAEMIYRRAGTFRFEVTAEAGLNGRELAIVGEGAEMDGTAVMHVHVVQPDGGAWPLITATAWHRWKSGSRSTQSVSNKN